MTDPCPLEQFRQVLAVIAWAAQFCRLCRGPRHRGPPVAMLKCPEVRRIMAEIRLP